MRSAATIAFEPRPSRRLLAGLLGVLSLTLFTVVSNHWPLGLRWPLLLITCAYGGWAVRRMHWRPWSGVRYFGDGCWELRRQLAEPAVAGELLRAHLLGGAIVLALRDARGRVGEVVLLADNCPVDVRRRLRIHLRHGGAN